MPNGFPYFLYASEDFCKGCNEPLCNHDRDRVYPDDGPTGSWHYRYFCKNGSRAVLPQAREMATDGGRTVDADRGGAE